MFVTSSTNGCWCWWHLITGHVSILWLWDTDDDAAIVAPRLTPMRSSHADWLQSQQTLLRGAVILNCAFYVKFSYHTDRLNLSHSPTTVHRTSQGQRGGADLMPTATRSSLADWFGLGGAAALHWRLAWNYQLESSHSLRAALTRRALRAAFQSTHTDTSRCGAGHTGPDHQEANQGLLPGKQNMNKRARHEEGLQHRSSKGRDPALWPPIMCVGGTTGV